MKRIVGVYPWPMHQKVAEKFAEIEDVTPVEARPGGPGPIVAIRTAPLFPCDAIVITDPAHLHAATRLVLGDGMELVLMREIMGATGEEIEDRTAKVRFE